MKIRKNVLGDAQSVKLTDEERKQMRESLVSYIEKNPVEKSEGKRAPRHAKRRRMMAVALAIIGFFLSAGLSIAASDASPGMPLYAVRTHFNERVREVFAPSLADRASLEVSLACERLKEADKLMMEGRLNEDMQQKLSRNFQYHVHMYEQHVQKLKVFNNPAQARSVEEKFKGLASKHPETISILSSGEGQSALPQYLFVPAKVVASTSVETEVN